MPDNKYRLYVILLTRVKPFTEGIVFKHIDHLKKLYSEDKLALCGPFIDYNGGMVVIKADSIEDARRIASEDPFVKEGFDTFEIRTLQVACPENDYLLADEK